MRSPDARVGTRVFLVVGVCFAAGLAVLAIAGAHAATLARLDAEQDGTVAVVCALLLASWIWPLVLYKEGESEAFHLDEAFFIILALLVPPAATVAAFATMTVLAQLLKRRQAIKSLFNFGQVTLAVGLGLVVSRAIAPPTPRLTVTELLATGAGAAVYFLVNSGAVSTILVAMGTSWRTCLLGGLGTRLVQAGSGALAGLLLALTISSYHWSVVLVVPVLLTLRLVLSGHFKARSDRARLQGLFDATLVANSQLRPEDVINHILCTARQLLRCSGAWVSHSPPLPSEMGAAVSIAGDELWLVVAGRQRQEPFDRADRVLLDALGAVGSGALTNAALYGQVRHERERLSSMTFSLGEGVCAVDRAGLLTFVNPAAASMLGLVATVVPEEGTNTSALPVAPEYLLRPARLAMQSRRVVRVEDTDFGDGSGEPVPVAFTASAILEGGKIVGAVLAFRDITERKALENDMFHHAFYDTLTGLANRRLVVDQLNRALKRSERDHKVHAVVFIDVDRFKAINDSFGHSTGDEVLVALAHQMLTTVRGGDMLARFGGDEFILLLEDVVDESGAIAAAARIRDAVQRPIVADGHEVVVTVSIGIALSEAGKTGDDILRNADVAMYHVKGKGRGGAYQLFDTVAMGDRSADRFDLEAELRKGIERGELEVYYQPFFAIDSQQVIGAEALVRWHHPVRGLLAPGEFIELAEVTGLILPLGRFVLEEACRQARILRDRLSTELLMNVNLSPRQFQQPGLLEEISGAVQAAGIQPGQIMLEITENMVMADIDSARTVMKKLKSLGVKLAIDDFGTGQSSLGYLKQFPVDEVKVDRSFVSGLGIDLVDSAIVKAVIDLTRALGITAVAEGVETSSQLSALRSMGCPIAQGYYFSRPLPAGALVELLDRNVPSPDPVDGIIQLT